jgi:CheY-like chemotaxis protein
MKNKSLNILLVEDDEFDIMNVKKALASGKIPNVLHVASNGLKALTMLRETDGHAPLIRAERRLILLDLNLPKMDGLEFLQTLRTDSQLKSIPVVVMTSSKQEQKQIEAYQLNVAGYIVKSLNVDRFIEAVQTLSQYWQMSEML